MLDFSLKYLHILKTKLAGLNLTNILDADEFYNKQILDSINPYLQSPLFQSAIQQYQLVVDVGFGGGFPILPLAKLLPEVQFVGVESRRKKVEAVTIIAEELSLTNVSLVHCRLQDFFLDVPAAITFKAVGTVADFLPLVHSADPKQKVFFYKGPSFLEKEASQAGNIQHWQQISLEEITVPSTEKRFLVTYQATNVPRGTFKKLVKLSDIL